MEYEKLGKKEMLKICSSLGAHTQHAVFGDGGGGTGKTANSAESLDDIDVGISLSDLDMMVDRTRDWKAPLNDAENFDAESIPLNIRDMLANEMKLSIYFAGALVRSTGRS